MGLFTESLKKHWMLLLKLLDELYCIYYTKLVLGMVLWF